jgi:hypothetical protein
MPFESSPRTVVVHVSVTVHLDPDDSQLREMLAEANNATAVDIVASEVQSNLESLDYVRHVAVRYDKPKEDQP